MPSQHYWSSTPIFSSIFPPSLPTLLLLCSQIGQKVWLLHETSSLIRWTLHSTQYLEPQPSSTWLLDLALMWFLFLEEFFSGSSLNVFSREPCPRFFAPFPTLYIFPVFSTQIHATQTFASISQTLIYYISTSIAHRYPELNMTKTGGTASCLQTAFLSY